MPTVPLAVEEGHGLLPGDRRRHSWACLIGGVGVAEGSAWPPMGWPQALPLVRSPRPPRTDILGTRY